MSFVYSHPFTGLANGLQTMNGATGPVGGWVELGRTTLGGAATTITVSSLPDKRYYMLLTDVTGTSAITANRFWRYNSDTGTNYADRFNYDGGSESTQTSQTGMFAIINQATTTPTFAINYIANRSANEKLSMTWGNHQNTAGAGTAPARYETVGKWTNTSDPIDEVTLYSGGAETFSSGSEVVVLGWDPADTHTNNFWEELANVSGDGTGGFGSGSITAKKYLWIQMWLDPSTTQFPKIQFNSDTGNNYASRKSVNGDTDATTTSFSGIDMVNSTSTPSFINMFVINNTSNEKLAILHAIGQNTAGASNAPDRDERVGKWANTSNQITSVDVVPNTGNYTTDSKMVIWGAD